jgi:hypothetical protein
MAVEFEKLDIDTVDSINNLDTMELINWVDAMLKEAGRSGSASNFESHEQDLITQKGILAHIVHRFESFVGAPELWLPNTHPKPQPVPIPPDLVRVENPTMQHCINLMIALRTQLLFSESAARMSGYVSREVDAVLRPLFAKTTAYIDDAIADLDNSDHSYLPDVNDQAPGANKGNPR